MTMAARTTRLFMFTLNKYFFITTM
jgi:hypothetical protein